MLGYVWGGIASIHTLCCVELYARTNFAAVGCGCIVPNLYDAHKCFLCTWPYFDADFERGWIVMGVCGYSYFGGCSRLNSFGARFAAVLSTVCASGFW
jgi:hypothetical protein